VGKTTVLMALAYLQQILEKGQCDPKYLAALGHKYVGGFKSLVYGHDLSRNIKIKVEFEPGLTVGSEYETYIELLQTDDNFIKLQDIAGNTEHVALEFEISWSERFQHAYVKNYRVWINHDDIGMMDSEEDTKQVMIRELNCRHELLFPVNHEEWLDSEGYSEFREDMDFIESEDKEIDVTDSLVSPVDEFLVNKLEGVSSDHDPLDRDFYNSFAHIEYITELVDVLRVLNPNIPLAWGGGEKLSGIDSHNFIYGFIAPIGVSGFSGALPHLNKRIVTNLIGEEYGSSEHNDFEVVTRALSQAFVAPLDMLLNLLKKSVYIGPLRTIPTPDFKGNPYPSQGDWFDGTAAWDLLDVGSDASLLKKVSSWFSDPDLLNTGYELHRYSFKYAFFSRISQEFIANFPDEVFEEMEKLFGDTSKIIFRDKSNGVELSPNQVGAGFSQVMPLIVAANSVKTGVVSIEQPELHIHPAFQVELGDLFTQLDVPESRRPMFLIETHSEHIMLRLLRRVRETTDGDLEEGINPVKPEDISVVYLESIEPSDNCLGGVKATRLEIDEQGEFIQRWPKGFFSERAEELF